MHIEWKFERLDEGDPEDQRRPQCLLEFSGRFWIDGKRAGLVNGYYAYDEPLDSNAAFYELWDMDARTCELFEELLNPKATGFRMREPLPGLLEERAGMLCIDTLLLWPPFRGHGLGRKLLRETVHHCADERVGAVVLKAEPLQYCRVEQWSDGSRDDDESVLEDLPRDDRDRDRKRLLRHFRNWGMQRVPRTRYMAAEPLTLCDRLAPSWPPCVIQEYGNTCVVCGQQIDFQQDEWESLEHSGVVHAECRSDDVV